MNAGLQFSDECSVPFTRMVIKESKRYLHGRAMAQVVSRRPLTAEARVLSRASPCGICVGRSCTGAGFSPSSSVSSVNISFHRRSPNSYLLGNA
jgi:hypothetical protein